MGTVCFVLFTALGSGLRSQAALQIENAALRHQLAVLAATGSRATAVAASRPAVLDVAVSPVARLAARARHRQARHGPPLASTRLSALLALEESAAWARAAPHPRAPFKNSSARCAAPTRPGAPRASTASCSSSASRSLKPRSGTTWCVVGPPPSQTWRTFLTNHVSQLVSVDFFVVPTFTFRVLFVFVVLAHDRRQILHVNVTGHPTAAWTAQQIRNAFPWDTAPRFLLRDRDGTYGDECRACLDAMGIDEVLTAPRSPWQNPYVERLIGSMRRECVDHVVVLNERSLQRIPAIVHRLLPSLAHASGVG